MIVIKLLPIKSPNADRPAECPYCNSQVLQRWGSVSRDLVNTDSDTTNGFRFRCTNCYRTFRAFPEGVSRSLLAFRIQYLAAWLNELGLSTREIEQVFEFLGSPISRSTISRMRGSYAGQMLDKRIASEQRFYIDREFINGVSQKFGVVLGIDGGSGKVLILGTLNESYPPRILSWLEHILDGVNVAVQHKSTQIALSN